MLNRTILTAVLILSSFPSLAATLTCEQVTDATFELAQFSSKSIEIVCSASGGTVSNIQINKNSIPAGLDFENVESMDSTLESGESDTLEWGVSGDSPNTYTISYAILCDSTSSWSGADSTEAIVTSPARLSVSYTDPPDSYSDGDRLDFRVDNLGGSTATNIKIKLFRDSTLVRSKDFPTSIEEGGSAAFSWRESDGFDRGAEYETKVFIDSSEHDSISVEVEEIPSVCGDGAVEGSEECDDANVINGDGCSSSCTEEDNGGDEGGDDGDDRGSSSSSIGGAYYYPETDKPVKSGDKIVIDTKGGEITRIEFTSKVDAPQMSVSLEKPNITVNYDEVYSVLQINALGFSDKDITSLKIIFQVPKPWIEREILAPEDIVLLGFDGKSWQELSTTKTGEDKYYYFYEAEGKNLGLVAIAARRPTLLTSLSPTKDELKDIANQALNDPLIKRKLEEHLLYEIDYEGSKKESYEVIENIELQKELKVLPEGNTLIEISIKYSGEETDVIMIEPIPKGMVENIDEIIEPSPRYDIIIKEDPIIQWRFKEVDTAIVAWEFDLAKEKKISYKVKGKFKSEDHLSSIIVKIMKKETLPTGNVIENQAPLAIIEEEPNNIYYLLGISIGGFILVLIYVFRFRAQKPSEKEVKAIEAKTVLLLPMQEVLLLKGPEPLSSETIPPIYYVKLRKYAFDFLEKGGTKDQLRELFRVHNVKEEVLEQILKEKY